MPEPGMLWRHFVINTLGTWLHGDERGFRSRHHRIHSSGDYRNPPPPGEHLGLHAYHEARSRGEITIARELRRSIGRAMAESLLARHYRLLALAVGKVHTHGLVELPEGLATVKAIIGEAKRHSSRAVRDRLPGSIWAAGGTFKIVSDDQHLIRANDYILYEQGAGAWSWSFQDASRDGEFGRTRSPGIRGGAGSSNSPALPRRVGVLSHSIRQTTE